MSWLGALLGIIQSILDRLPSRKESLLNAIQDKKDEIKKLQQKSAPWTIPDSAKYSLLLDELSKLEKRRDAIG